MDDDEDVLKPKEWILRVISLDALSTTPGVLTLILARAAAEDTALPTGQYTHVHFFTVCCNVSWNEGMKSF